MESLAFAGRKIPRKDLITGLGTSFLVHFLVFSSAFIWAWVMPSKPLKPPYCTVNLVSLKDIGMGTAEPKGSPKGAEEAIASQNVRSSGKTAGQSASVAPIKKLTVDDSLKKSEVQIKKIEPKEVPVEHEKSQGLEAIEKNLDKLVAKPKVLPRTSSPAEGRRLRLSPATRPRPPRCRPGANRGAKNRPGEHLTELPKRAIAERHMGARWGLLRAVLLQTSWSICMDSR